MKTKFAIRKKKILLSLDDNEFYLQCIHDIITVNRELYECLFQGYKVMNIN